MKSAVADCASHRSLLCISNCSEIDNPSRIAGPMKSAVADCASRPSGSCISSPSEIDNPTRIVIPSDSRGIRFCLRSDGLQTGSLRRLTSCRLLFC
jgi:hypothetical protein